MLKFSMIILFSIMNLSFLLCSSEFKSPELAPVGIQKLKDGGNNGVRYKNITILSGHSDKIFSIKFVVRYTPSFICIIELVSAAYDKTCRTWDINSGNQLVNREEDYKRIVSPNLEFKSECEGKTSCFKNYFEMQIHSVRDDRILNFLKITSDIKLTKWSPDSSKLAIVLNNQQLLIWNWQEDKVIDVKCCLWKYRSSNLPIFDNTYENDDVKRLEWSPDGKKIAVISKTGIVRIWNVATRTYVSLDSLVNCLAWSPDSSLIALALNDNSIKIIDSSTYLKIKNFGDLEDSIRLLSWPSHSEFLASVSNKYVIIWDAKTGQVLCDIKIEDHKISLVVWSSCNNYLALCCYDCNKIFICRRAYIQA
jgi:WD40 repeat protein